MEIYLGNLELEDIVLDRYLERVKKALKDFKRIDDIKEAKNTENGYHIFDVPRVVVFYDRSKALEAVKKLQDELKDEMNNAWRGEIHFVCFKE